MNAVFLKIQLYIFHSYHVIFKYVTVDDFHYSILIHCMEISQII